LPKKSKKVIHFYKKPLSLSKKRMQYEQFIEVTEGVRSGKPCIKGTRITVQDVLEMLASGMSFEDIILDFPLLNEAKIRAVLSFAASRESRIKMVAA
jgi:uncharacterized protein (DUF433 family)